MFQDPFLIFDVNKITKFFDECSIAIFVYLQ